MNNNCDNSYYNDYKDVKFTVFISSNKYTKTIE